MTFAPDPCELRDLGVVAHLHHVFFAGTESFIHHAITGMRRFRPICLAWEYRNLDLFPLPDSVCFHLGSRRFSPAWWLEGLARRLGGRELRADRILRRQRAVLVHAHFGPAGVLALRLRRGAELPLVTTFYGHDLSLPEREPAWRERYRELFARGRLFLVEGPHMAVRLQQVGCPVGKVAVQRIAIPVSELPFRSRLPKGRDESVVLVFSGRFVEKKGLLDALAAVLEVRARFPRLELRIIGDGPMRAAVARFVSDHGMEPYVRVLGFLSYRDYREEMGRADIFLSPSATAADGDSEGGAPTTILEAQALGIPVVATRHADIPNVVVPGESALLCPERDTAALAGNILQLLEDQECWAPMGAAGRRFVESFHDVDREIPRLESRYAGLVGDVGGGW